MAPRKTNEEAIADLERQLVEAKAKAEEKIQAHLASVQAKLAEAKAKSAERRTATLAKLDEQIEATKVRLAKVETRLAELQTQRDELVASIGTAGDDEAPADPEQVDDERTEVNDPEPVEVTASKSGKRRADAA